MLPSLTFAAREERKTRATPQQKQPAEDRRSFDDGKNLIGVHRRSFTDADLDDAAGLW